MTQPLLSVPNFSEGRDAERISAIRGALLDAVQGVRLLDEHADAVHNRSVLTLAGEPEALLDALAAGAEAAIAHIDMRRHSGEHPRIGALDVCPIVWLGADQRPAAESAVRSLAPRLAELGLPVFLYGALAAAPERAERAYFRRGGPETLARRMASGELVPDAGPDRAHPTAGAVLLAARPPLAAFNVELEGATLSDGRQIAAGLREAGGGPDGVRAIAIELAGGRVQISTNVHDPVAVPLGRVVEEIRRRAAPLGATPALAELVGLVPAAALEGLPRDVPFRDLADPTERTIEHALGA